MAELRFTCVIVIKDVQYADRLPGCPKLSDRHGGWLTGCPVVSDRHADWLTGFPTVSDRHGDWRTGCPRHSLGVLAHL